jgi:uncharacterized protein (TIGR02246 family)
MVRGRVLPILTVIIAAASLAACGSTTPAGSATTASSSTTSDATTSAAPITAATITTATDTQSDRADITAALNAWPAAWADRDAAAVCGLFAPDVTFTFQGGTDRDYQQACSQFTTLLGAADKTVSYLPPDIESIDVDGDLAAVRLIWTATISGADGTALETTEEKGLDILRRQPDGDWQITVSYAFPLS